MTAIKLDAEGAEAAALAGADHLLAELRPALVIEVNAAGLRANGSDRRELQAQLVGAGYRTFTIDDATATLVACTELLDVDEENVVALPAERAQPLSRLVEANRSRRTLALAASTRTAHE